MFSEKQREKFKKQIEELDEQYYHALRRYSLINSENAHCNLWYRYASKSKSPKTTVQKEFSWEKRRKLSNGGKQKYNKNKKILFKQFFNYKYNKINHGTTLTLLFILNWLKDWLRKKKKYVREKLRNSMNNITELWSGKPHFTL